MEIFTKNVRLISSFATPLFQVFRNRVNFPKTDTIMFRLKTVFKIILICSFEQYFQNLNKNLSISVYSVKLYADEKIVNNDVSIKFRFIVKLAT